MKKIFTLLAFAAAGTVMSQAAVSVKYNGEEVADGATVTVNASDFKDEGFPEIGLNRWTGEISLEVDGEAPVTALLESNTSDMQFCPAGQSCFTLFADGEVFTGSGDIVKLPCEVPVHLVYSGLNIELPKAVNWLNVSLRDAAGSEKKLRLVFDTQSESGVSKIVADADSYTVFSLTGVKVLDGADAGAVDALPAGLYIVNGKKVCVK